MIEIKLEIISNFKGDSHFTDVAKYYEVNKSKISLFKNNY